MSLEQTIAENNDLLRQLIDLQKANLSSGSTGSTGETTSSAKATTGGKKTTGAKKTTAAEVVDPDTLKNKLIEYKNLTDMKAAKALTKKLGYDAIADVPDDKSKEVFDAISAAIIDLDNGNTTDGDDDEAL